MAKNPRIQVDITGDAAGLKKAAKDAEKAVEDIDESVGGLDGKGVDKFSDKVRAGFRKAGDAAKDLASDRLGPLGDAADLAGIELGGMSTAALAGGAALVGLGAFVAQGVGKLTELTDNVRKFRDASGASWEESSRLSEAMGDLGINSDASAGAMGRLAKAVDADKLSEYGIAVEYAADGSTDLIGTLGNVADEFSATTDPAERAGMASAIFGRSWVDLAPILSRGSAGIKELTDGVEDSKIVTEESAAAQLEYKLAMDDLQGAIDGLQTSMASDLIPTLTALAGVGTKALGWVDKAREYDVLWKMFTRGGEAIAGLGDDTDDTTKATEDLARETANAAEEAENAADAIRDQAEAEKELESKIKDATQSINDQIRAYQDQQQAVLASFSKDLAYERQQRKTTESINALAAATEERDRIVGDGVPTTEAGTKAVEAYEEALFNAKNEALSEAASAAEVARSHAEATKQTDPATAATLAYRDSLVEMRDKAADPTLREYLDGLIRQLDAVRDSGYGAANGLYAAGTAWSQLVDLTREKALSSGAANIIAGMGAVPTAQARLAEGGPVQAGKTYLVGEEGPELFRSNTSGEIIPNDQLGSMAAQRAAVRTAPMAGGQTIYNIEIRTGADPDAVVAAIERFRRRNGGLPW